jgi:hypothetical protein
MTKKEILTDSLGDYDGWIEGDDRGVYAAMDTYAAQCVKEYKEKLTKRLQDFSVDKHGRIFTTEVIELIEKI